MTVLARVLPLAAVVVYAVLAVRCGWGVPCPFRLGTGHDCPTCGVTRSIHALVTGDFALACRMNLAAIPVLVILFRAALPPRRGPRWIHSTAADIVLLAAFFAGGAHHAVTAW